MLGDMREEKKLSHITPLSPTCNQTLFVTKLAWNRLTRRNFLNRLWRYPSGGNGWFFYVN